ncbi:MAG TPA: hypothetical protein VJW51_01180 [Candidatus Acidoferrales bacterium]|nr:hypothetical protein [Candidatus Acidoferrales bacterium]
MATHVHDLNLHAIRDAIVQTQKDMREARRSASPAQRKAIDLKIRFLDKQRAVFKQACRFGRGAHKLDIV